MRVIGGTYRSRRLIAPRGLATRPTSDRLRETLFNVLAPRIEGAVFADLYAGSGAVGIEAISRGASLVYFVDQRSSCGGRDPQQSRCTRDPLRLPDCIQQRLRRIAPSHWRSPERCAIIFLDPPYAAGNEYAGTLSEHRPAVQIRCSLPTAS